jgi:integrase
MDLAFDRRISVDEIERLLFALGYDYEQPPVTVTSRVGLTLLFALETGMHTGEIAGLTWDRVDLERRFVRLIETKNGTRRDVPLSTEALRLIRQAKEVTEGALVFQVTVQQIDVLFRKGKARALIDDLHFYDSRHEGGENGWP